MKGSDLTKLAGIAYSSRMKSEDGRARWSWRAAMLSASLVPATLGLGGCINLTAPSEPIVIELNINITQEVIYRLAEDASDAIDENADIF